MLERERESENVRISPTAATLGFLGSGKEAKKILSLSLYTLLHTYRERNYREERMHVWVLLYRGRERRPWRKVCMCVLVHRIPCAIVWVGRFLGAVFRYKSPIPTFPLDSLLSLPTLREQSV